MRKKIFTIFLYLALFTLTGSFINAQTFDHNTGNILVTVFQNGYMGHGALGAGGNGVQFMGAIDACFTGGIMYGDNVNGLAGSVGSFEDGTGVLLVDDMVNSVPISNTSNANFDQITLSQFMDTFTYGFEVDQTTYSNSGDDYVFLKFVISNFSGNNYSNFRVGFFCDWDVGGTNYLFNKGGLDESRNLVYQWEDGGAADLNYYGIVAFNDLTGGTTSFEFPGTNETIRNVMYDWISVITPPIVLQEDHRSFIGSGPYTLNNGQSLMVGFGVVAGENLADLQSNTDAAQAIWDNVIIPVELTSFTGSVNHQGEVILNWSTATEVNNQLFEIERKTETTEFVTIGYVNGYGTTTDPQEYSYIDENIETGIYFYRLKQIDFQGTYEYSDVIELDVKGPSHFALGQNYPNPFNPSTQIEFRIPETGNVKLAVYNLVGEEVALLVNGQVEAGVHEVTFNASNLPSGAYFYKLQSGSKVEVKKMLLTK